LQGGSGSKPELLIGGSEGKREKNKNLCYRKYVEQAHLLNFEKGKSEVRLEVDRRP